jgi:hypothetical protein
MIILLRSEKITAQNTQADGKICHADMALPGDIAPLQRGCFRVILELGIDF